MNPPEKEDESSPPSGAEKVDRSTSMPIPVSSQDLRSFLTLKRGISTSSSGSSTETGSKLKEKIKKSRSKRKKKYHASHCSNTSSSEPHLKRARLFVGNINPNITRRRDIIELFSEYGDVLGVSLHKGFAFVQMDRESSANRAINNMDNCFLKGSRLGKVPKQSAANFEM